MIFVLLFLILPSGEINLLCPSVIGGKCESTRINPILGGLVTITHMIRNSNVGISLFTNIDVSFILLSIISSYILSCFIIWIYDKVKKK